MGLDVSAMLVAGVQYAEVVCSTVESRTVTRYDKNTGVKYAEEMQERVYRFGELVRTRSEWDAFDWEARGLTVFGTDENEQDLIGVKVAVTGSHRAGSKPVLVAPEHVQRALEQAEKSLRELGVDGPVQLFLLYVLSY